MDEIAPISSLTPKQSIAALQELMDRFSQTAIGHSQRASLDFKALQLALETGNVADAQDALARLQRDSAIYGSTPAAPAPSPDPAHSAADGKVIHDANGLDVTA